MTTRVDPDDEAAGARQPAGGVALRSRKTRERVAQIARPHTAPRQSCWRSVRLVDVRKAHDRTLAYGRAAIFALEDLLDELDRVNVPTELAAMEDGPAFAALDSTKEAVTQSCLELTQAAADNEITVDLRCG